MIIDLNHFKIKLEEETALVEKELETVGRRNPDNLSDWEAVPASDRDVSQADENIVADSIEGYEDNIAIVKTLEERYNDIKSALDKIKNSSYGLCQICQKEIELDRLEANPSARTCKEHMDTTSL